jgi:hypothetical protein
MLSYIRTMRASGFLKPIAASRPSMENRPRPGSTPPACGASKTGSPDVLLMASNTGDLKCKPRISWGFLGITVAVFLTQSRIGENWPRCCPSHPSPSLFLSVSIRRLSVIWLWPCRCLAFPWVSSLFGPVKPVPRPVPAKFPSLERPERVKGPKRLAVLGGKAAKPASVSQRLDARGRGDTLHAGRGEALLKTKTSARRAVRIPLPACNDSVRIKTGKLRTAGVGQLPVKNLPVRVIGFRGGRLHEATRAKGGAIARSRGGRLHVDKWAFPPPRCGQMLKLW